MEGRLVVIITLTTHRTNLYSLIHRKLASGPVWKVWFISVLWCPGYHRDVPYYLHAVPHIFSPSLFFSPLFFPYGARNGFSKEAHDAPHNDPKKPSGLTIHISARLIMHNTYVDGRNGGHLDINFPIIQKNQVNV